MSTNPPGRLPFETRRVASAVVVPLRTAVLRPSFPPGTLATYERDEASGTIHVAAFDGSEVVGVATVYAEAPPEPLRGGIPAWAYEAGAAWQLRGMATSAAARGTGAGAAALAEVAAAVADGGGRAVWCNARLGAVGFYTRQGWAAVGPEFDIVGIGPHVVMWRPA